MANSASVDGSGVCAKVIGNVSALVFNMLFASPLEKLLDGQSAPVK
jgi:hypothetical protein